VVYTDTCQTELGRGHVHILALRAEHRWLGNLLVIERSLFHQFVNEKQAQTTRDRGAMGSCATRDGQPEVKKGAVQHETSVEDVNVPRGRW
jgi:hypothetical protein